MSKVYIPEIPHVLETFSSTSARAVARKDANGCFNAWDLWAVARCKQGCRPDRVLDGVPSDASQPRWLDAIEAEDYLQNAKVPFMHDHLPARDMKSLAGTYVPVTADDLFLVNDLFNRPIRAYPAFAQRNNADVENLNPFFPEEEIERASRLVMTYQEAVMFDHIKNNPEYSDEYAKAKDSVRSKAIQRLVEEHNGPGPALRDLLPKFARAYNSGRNTLYLGEYSKAIAFI